jgi:hypothetical protein
MNQDIAEKLAGKKELRDIDRGFLLKVVSKIFEGSDTEGERRRKFKEMRRLLRKIYGMFRQVREKRGGEVYEEIFKRIGEVKSVLDVGCGRSPLDFPFKKHKIEYYACDISREDVEEVGKVVDEAFLFDLVFGNYSRLPKADACFCFKVLEGLEDVKEMIRKECNGKRKGEEREDSGGNEGKEEGVANETSVSERVLKGVRCRWVVVSFARKSLGGGKNIRKQGRVWFMKLLNGLGWHYEIFNSEDEIFFVIKKPEP